ncbi:VOC family protein [Propionibacteriaceae bacterium Y2011]
MINGLHLLMYSTDAPADRAFLRDVLGWAHLIDDDSSARAGEEWLIFRTPPTELGVHPTEGVGGAEKAPPTQPVTTLHLMCDDITATVAELRDKGVDIVGEPTDLGYGVGCEIRLPSGAVIGLYESRHEAAHGL